AGGWQEACARLQSHLQPFSPLHHPSWGQHARVSPALTLSWGGEGGHEEDTCSSPSLIPQYKGKANLHVFEDWCGGAVRHLRKNLHFPLFPHTRTTVKKLAVSPKWKNYGLRIFGYIHPFKDGDFQFSVASDDNSEFWLSSDDSPSNSRLAAFVGKLGTEWTAPGEFTKFSSQVSKPLRLMSSRRYYFELLHKQDDRGSDHVEVGWRVFLPSLKFEVIDSSYISLYTDESSLKMNHVEHIPQTLASHSGSYLWEAQRDEHGADMLKSDPRDTFFLTPAIEASRVENVLVPCAYSPTYVVKDFPIARYQGLQFVYLSFVYPNDFTRLTHMETENKCFYRESPLYLENLLALGTEGLFSRETHEDTTPAPGRTAATAAYNSSEVARSEGPRVTSFLKMSETTVSQREEGKGQEEEEEEEEEVSDYSYETGELQQSWLEDSINWQRTFSVSSVDFELLRSDWNDLRCNVSGNLQLSETAGSRAGVFEIVNVEKRRDTARGNRYLLELELAERGQRTVRLSEYVYVLLWPKGVIASCELPRWSRLLRRGVGWGGGCSQAPRGEPEGCLWLCLAVKNQARWVQQFISDMAHLYGATKDTNFNVILVDFDSDDMDVEKALQDARLPRYQYLRRTGNFERSAGLQAGVDTVEDGHSIVFLCDLHIHFPPNILDSIRKHCVEGKLAYAPIVMRLSCGSSPREPNGYWEVNGFGLFGIYKSDFDRVGGMNTEEFRDRWGGEDWELLDRVLQSGLEVERLRLRNFYHYYHSKRGMWNARSKKPPKD
uniref:Beta-1,4-N-acetylgalactosaminyltransferase n=1 Tax=Bubo bubo TaxID=30461 RepID=A0A8C0IF85_BUBBB